MQHCNCTCTILYTMIVETVFLSEVDYVECVSDIWGHARDFKIEPEEKQLREKGGLKRKAMQTMCGRVSMKNKHKTTSNNSPLCVFLGIQIRVKYQVIFIHVTIKGINKLSTSAKHTDKKIVDNTK